LAEHAADKIPAEPAVNCQVGDDHIARQALLTILSRPIVQAYATFQPWSAPIEWSNMNVST
jgi:hypothetical protein